MKSNKKIIILIVLTVLLVSAVIINKISLRNNKDEMSSNTCNDSSFIVESYNANYSPKESRYVFLSSSVDYQENDFFTDDKLSNLDFEKYDYLIYFLDSQGGCDRSKRLKCVEYTNQGIKLNFEYNDVDLSCDAIFFDALVIELEKDKYNDKLNIEETLYEVGNVEK